ncbi:putative pentatricopeptide repeat-containing protein At5g43820 [Magnolia sinica]|uniref:putative pentatricopeptide repeat-containing protein At5g43820 n=1 Tax=Magnolia sinica TaxID=86752 RepID=UPI00265B6777|nr:putative pentatricopeptide repeat-containing protein At5g43820 [Magnolia sinica]XP_058098591.1 putative pentatricopeptide repeat-containing protein At5g43820 [Magnolia sinica]
MAARFVGFLSLVNRTRYFPFSSISISPFSSLDLPSNHLELEKPSQKPPKPSHRIDEQFVLLELSDLLRIDAETSNDRRFLENPIKNHAGSSNLLLNDAEIPSHLQFIGDSVERCVDAKTSNYRQFVENPAKTPVVSREMDGFLSPAEKLRGVFLQKLKGRAMIESSLSATSVDLTVEIVAEVVNRGNLGGQAMVLFFNWAVRQPKVVKDLETFHTILKALGRRKFFNHMEEVLYRMKNEGTEINDVTISIVMDSFVRARRVAKAVQFFERLGEFGKDCDCESLNALLKCLCQRSHVGTANSIFNAMKGKVAFNRMTYNIVIGGWSKLGRVGEIERNLKMMIADGLNPDCLTFSYLLEGLGRAGRVDDAVAVFEKLEEKGCIPDTITYNAMICNFISIGDLDECVKYYEGMLQKNIVPDMDTYTRMIGSFIKVRRVADALEMFDEMLGRGILPSTGTVTSFIEPLCSFGPPYAAMMIYKNAKKVGCRISLKAYKLLLMRLSRFGKCGMVLKVWEEMQDSGFSSDMEVYEYVINGLCNIGQLENAVLVMEDAMHKGFCPSKVIYSKLNNKLLNANKVERAYKLFLKVKNVRRYENAWKYSRANGWHF